MGQTRFFHAPRKGKMAAIAGGMPEVQALMKKGEPVWLDFVDPRPEDLQALVEPFEIHPLSIEDCMDEDMVPKIDIFPNYSFILFNAFTYRDGEVLLDEVDFILGNHFLISVRGARTKNTEYFAKLNERLGRSQALASKGPEFLMETILDFMVDENFKAIELVEDDIDKLEETMLGTDHEFRPQDLLGFRNCLLNLRKSLFHEREVMIKICRRDSPQIGEKAVFYFRDIYDHLTKFFELIEINRERITSLLELSLSLINNRMSKISNQTNEVVKRLTIINVIFMPLTLLAGIGGMSEWSMMTGPDNWYISYPIFFGLMGGLAIGIHRLMKHFRWI